jgi:hypothetical protein
MHFYSIYASILLVGTTRVQKFLCVLLNWGGLGGVVVKALRY